MDDIIDVTNYISVCDRGCRFLGAVDLPLSQLIRKGISLISVNPFIWTFISMQALYLIA